MVWDFLVLHVYTESIATVHGRGMVYPIAEDQCKIDTFQIIQRCLHRVRECNKRGVPNADIMLRPIPQSNHLSPVKGEFEGRRRGQLIGLHARLSSSTRVLLAKYWKVKNVILTGFKLEG